MSFDAALERESALLFHPEWDALIGSLPIGMICLNASGQIVFANLAARSLLNQSLLGLQWIDCIQHIIAPRPDDGHELTLKNGKRIHVTTQALEQPLGQLIILNDLSETRALQDKLQCNMRLSALSDILAELAHQIRTPLSSALIYAKNIVDYDLSIEKIQEYAQKTVLCLANIESQIHASLQFSKGASPVIEAIDLFDLVEELKEICNIPHFMPRIAFQSVIGIERFKGNKPAIVGALQNLVNNAIQAIEGVGKIQVSVEKKGEAIEFSVLDTGKGMKDDILLKALTPFFTTKAKGTGLGLAIVEATAKAHQGQVFIESKLGKGTCVRMVLPLIK